MALHQPTLIQSSAHKPQLRDWVRICFKIGALAFGGAGRAQMIREEVVEKRQWLSAEEFQEITTVSAFLPGSNLINLAIYIGCKFFGTLGAVATVAVIGLPGAVGALLVVWFVPFGHPDVQRLFQGFSIGSLVLLAVYVAKLAKGLKSQHIAAVASGFKLALRFLLAAMVFLAAFFHAPFVVVLCGGIFFGLILEFLV